jgi:uncharacterized damage-inducible protein DinB
MKEIQANGGLTGMFTIQKLFAHMDWANRRLLDALQNAPANEASKPAALFQHLLHAELIWLNRLRGESSQGLALWVELADLDACAALIEENGGGFRTWLDACPEDRLDSLISYHSQTGVRFESSARDILTHVALHGQYHRGQINTALRNLGLEPPVLDYILFSRNELKL